MAIPAQVRLVEVGPRDGLQNEPCPVPTAVKIELIHRLVAAGLRDVESAAFVSPKWVPQMADATGVMQGIRREPGVSYSALVPNLQGWEAALAAGVGEIAVFASASESFSRRNINCSIDESLRRFAAVIAAARAAGVRVRGYVSCALDCPYEGAMRPEAAATVARALLDLGCAEISLADTIGTGTPARTRRLIEVVAAQVPVAQLAGHFHDTYGQALANILAALEYGIGTFESSVAGLGGCPYAPGAGGNVATEDVVYLLDGLGVATGVDLSRLVEAGEFISAFLGRPPDSKTARALLARRKAAAAG